MKKIDFTKGLFAGCEKDTFVFKKDNRKDEMVFTRGDSGQICSALNPGNYSFVSNIALAIEMLANGHKVNVLEVEDASIPAEEVPTYVEFGEPDDRKKMILCIRNKTFFLYAKNDVTDLDAVIALYYAIIYGKKFREKICDIADVATAVAISEIFKTSYTGIGSSDLYEGDIYVSCDAFEYGIAKVFDCWIVNDDDVRNEIVEKVSLNSLYAMDRMSFFAYIRNLERRISALEEREKGREASLCQQASCPDEIKK